MTVIMQGQDDLALGPARLVDIKKDIASVSTWWLSMTCPSAHLLQCQQKLAIRLCLVGGQLCKQLIGGDACTGSATCRSLNLLPDAEGNGLQQ